MIVTQLRLRPGDQIANPAEGDGLTINPGVGGQPVERRDRPLLAAVGAGRDAGHPQPIVSNVTVQYSIIAAGLSAPRIPRLTATVTLRRERDHHRPGTPSQYGPTSPSIATTSPTTTGATPRGIGTLGIEYVNNVFYNWGSKLGHANPRGINVVGNVFRKGPDTVGSDEVYVTQVKNSYPRPFADSV